MAQPPCWSMALHGDEQYGMYHWVEGLGMLKLYIGGLYGARRQGSAVGLAKALRLAFPDARLIGVDYSAPPVDIQWPELDEIWSPGPVGEPNSAISRSAIEQRIQIIP